MGRHLYNSIARDRHVHLSIFDTHQKAFYVYYEADFPAIWRTKAREA